MDSRRRLRPGGIFPKVYEVVSVYFRCAGIMLVFVLIAVLALPGAGWKLTASHACNESGRFRLTNCCADDEVFYCWGEMCVVAHGCTVCTTKDCWELRASGISAHPNFTFGEGLYHHLSLALLGAYVCEGVGVGEHCSVAILLAFVAQKPWGSHPALNCSRPCGLEAKFDALEMFEGPLTDILAMLVKWCITIPEALWAALVETTGFVAVLFLIYLLEERFVHAILVLIVVVTAKTATALALVGLLIPSGVGAQLVRETRRTGFLDSFTTTYQEKEKQLSDYYPCEPSYKNHCNITFPRVRFNYRNSSWQSFRNMTCEYGLTQNISIGVGRAYCEHGYIIWDIPRYENKSYVTDIHACTPHSDGEPWNDWCNHYIGWSSAKDPSLCKKHYVICRWGSHALQYNWGNHTFTEPGSATCLYFDAAKKPYHTCMRDRRAPWCGEHVRGAWAETGDKWFDFEHCGVGTRITGDLVATTARRKATAEVVHVKLGGLDHWLLCPLDKPANTSLRELLPGSPASQSFEEWWSMVIGSPFMRVPAGRWYYDVCPGYAYRYEDPKDGLLHESRGRQPVSGGKRPRGYFMFDAFVLVLALMKMTGARWVPLVVLGIWVQLTSLAHGAPLNSTEASPAGDFAMQVQLEDLDYFETRRPPCGVDAAIAPWVPAGPMAGAVVEALRHQAGLALPVDLVLLVLNLIIYLRSEWAGKLVALAGFKLSAGFVFTTWLGVLGWARHRHSVAGDCTVCITMGGVDVISGWWATAVFVSYVALTLATFTRTGKSVKLELYAKWAVCYGWLYDRLSASPVGHEVRNGKVTLAWWAACCLWPQDTLCVMMWMYTILGLIDAWDIYLEVLLVISPDFDRLARLLSNLAGLCDGGPFGMVAAKLTQRGFTLHLKGRARVLELADAARRVGASMKHIAVSVEELEEIKDDAFTIAVGSQFDGKPVVWRRGSERLVTHDRANVVRPPGFRHGLVFKPYASALYLICFVSVTQAFVLKHLIGNITSAYKSAETWTKGFGKFLVTNWTRCTKKLFVQGIDPLGGLPPEGVENSLPPAFVGELFVCLLWCFAVSSLAQVTWGRRGRVILAARMAARLARPGRAWLEALLISVVLAFAGLHIWVVLVMWAATLLAMRAVLRDFWAQSVRRINRDLAVLLRGGLRQEAAFLVEHAKDFGGILLYEHCGQVDPRLRSQLRAAGWPTEPVWPRHVALSFVEDEHARCGDLIYGQPVVCRKGKYVGVGAITSQSLPEGWVFTAPMLLRRAGKNFFSVLATSMRGVDEDTHIGNVMMLGTAMTRSFGTCTSGVMYTTFHSSGGRSIATPDGPVSPRWTSASTDVAAYPQPRGCKQLEPCCCKDTSAWVIRRDGGLAHGRYAGDAVLLDTDGRVRDFKGSSGSPVLCDSGHVIAMVVAARHRGPRVNSIRVVVPWTIKPKDVTSPAPEAGLPLPRGEYRVEPLFAPTGGGKSTRVPAEYVKMGYKVLVLNPSVATTAAMLGYMKTTYNLVPNIFCGSGPNAKSIAGGSGLTYCTYGRLLGGACSLLRKADVVICDECHSTDSTTILGIGAVLAQARACGVQLVVMATATPPGSHVVKHPNIEEAELPRDGDIQFYGLTLNHQDYARGRHLIFCHSKAECERVATDLTRHRIKAVTFYRGKPVSAIPESGDCVVVATDALSTGYSGNFDTVTDCNTCISEGVEVDLAPTVVLTLRSTHCNAALRMQRRGRTGRGRKGTYRYVTPSASPVGMVSTGELWQAAESAVIWFDLTKRQTLEYLDTYNQSPYTPLFPSSAAEAVEFFEVLRPFRTTPEVKQMLIDNVNWPLLSGAQLRLCLQNDAKPPAPDPRWAKAAGKNACPLLAKWGALRVEIAETEWTQKLQQALGVAGDTPVVGPALLVGAAFAAAAAIVNAAGCLVVVSDWTVGTVEGGKVDLDAQVVLETLESVETDLSGTVAVDALRAAMETARGAAAAASNTLISWWGPIPASPDTWHLMLQRLTTHWSTAATGVVAVLTSGANPVLASMSAFVTGLMTNLPITSVIGLGMLGGAVCTAVGGPTAGCAVTAAFLGGTLASTRAVLTDVMGYLGGWEAVVTAATFTFHACCGTLDKDFLPRLLACVVAPGAAVAGAVIGVLLWKATNTKGAQEWTNRLLAALPKGTALPDNFYLDADPRQKMSNLLDKVSLIQTAKRLINHLAQGDETPCFGGFWELLGDLVHWFRTVVFGLINWLKGSMPSLSLPLVHCQSPYKGGWQGSGVVTAKCPCGNHVTLQIKGGIVTWRSDTRRMCVSYLTGGVPINTEGASRGPVPMDTPLEGGIVARYAYGFTDWVEVKYTAAGPELVASTCPVVSRNSLQNAISRRPMLVGGVSTSWTNYHTPSVMTYTAGAVIRYAGADIKLPIKLVSGSQIDRDPGTLADEPAFMCDDLDANVESCPLVEVSSTPGAINDEVREPYVGAKRSGTVPLRAKWRGGSPPTPSLWCAKGMSVRQFKRELCALVGTKFPLRVLKGGYELLDEEKFPTEEVEIEYLDEDPSPPPVLRAPMWCEQTLTYSIDCCGLDENITQTKGTVVWYQDQTLGTVVDRLAGRLMAAGALYQTFHKVWSPADFKSHIPKINGHRVSWEIGTDSLKDLGALPSPHLTLDCYNPRQRGSYPTKDQIPSAMASAKIVSECKQEGEVRFFVGEAAMSALSPEWHNVDDARSCCLALPNLVLSDHQLWIGSRQYDITEPVGPEAADCVWTLKCLHGPVPGDTDSLEMPELEEDIEIDECESALMQPIQQGGKLLSVRVACCGAADTRWSQMVVQGKEGIRLIDLLMTHMVGVSSVGDPIWDRAVWEAHTPRIAGREIPWEATPADIVETGVVPISIDCGKTRPLTQAIPPQPVEEGFSLRVTCKCCGRDSSQVVMFEPGDPASVVFDALGLSHDHELVLDGDRYSAGETLPFDDGQATVRCLCEETPCGFSYVWYGTPLHLKELRKRPPTTPLGGYLKADPGQAYRTDPAQVFERIDKVTRIQQEATLDVYLNDAYNAAIGAAKKVRSPGFSYEEAVARVRPKAAPGHNVKCTVKDLQTPYGRQCVEKALEDIKARRGEHPFCLAAKQEVFAMTKKTRKPPRLICYPSLEFRVAEKMIMGDPAVVAKAVLGPAYGFQYTPQQRVKRLLEMWKSKRDPEAISVDAVCFDSSITPADVARETEIYAAASDDPDAVRALGERYASGPMVNSRGVIVGQRNCRASGVLTTSSSNSITCFLKVSAACRAVGVKKPSFLIHGDDTVIICEHGTDAEALRAKLAEYGYESDPKISKTLDNVETCSSFIGEAFSDRKEYFLSTDMSRAIARACSEWSDPIASACGYTLMYPWHPVVRYLLLAQVLMLIFKRGGSPRDEVVCDVRGNTVKFPLVRLPEILVALHGPGCLRVRSDSAKTLIETNKALGIMRCKGLGWYKRRFLRDRVALLRAGGDWAYLARTLMWVPTSGPPPQVKPCELGDLLEAWEHPWEGGEFSVATSVRPERKVGIGWIVGLTVAMGMLATVATV